MPTPDALDERLRERIATNLGRFARRPHPGADLRAAAVAVVITEDDRGRPSFILTRRAAKLRKHSRQWALPGGSLDPGETAEEAALRELAEEVGLGLPPDAVLGRLDDYPTRSGFAITPVVVWGGVHRPLAPNPAEVESVHHVALTELADPGVLELRRIPESERPVIALHLLGRRIHAPTAAVLYQLSEVALLGRETRVAHFEQPVFAWR